MMGNIYTKAEEATIMLMIAAGESNHEIRKALNEARPKVNRTKVGIRKHIDLMEQRGAFNNPACQAGMKARAEKKKAYRARYLSTLYKGHIPKRENPAPGTTGFPDWVRFSSYTIRGS